MTHFTFRLYFHALKRSRPCHTQMRHTQMPGGILQLSNFEHSKYLSSSLKYLWQHIPAWATIRPLPNGTLLIREQINTIDVSVADNLCNLTVSDKYKAMAYFFLIHHDLTDRVCIWFTTLYSDLDQYMLKRLTCF